jgi:hypothetical protein
MRPQKKVIRKELTRADGFHISKGRQLVFIEGLTDPIENSMSL